MVLLDFMHASQWHDTRINRSVYYEMRRVGLPPNSFIGSIVSYVQFNLEQNHSLMALLGYS